MTVKAHFQWQNEHLLRTIYPLREMKLRDFLLFFKEIELWAQYKDLDPAHPDLQGEFERLERAREASARSAHAAYHRQLDYFRQDTLHYLTEHPDERTFQKTEDRLTGEHRTFQKYFFTYDSTRKQNNFLQMMILRVEGFQQSLKTDVDRLKRNLVNYRAQLKPEPRPADPDRPKDPAQEAIKVRLGLWESELEITQQSLNLVNDELGRLYELLGTFNQLKSDLDLILAARFRGGPRPDARSLDSLRDHDPESVLEFLRSARPRSRPSIKDLVLAKAQAFRDELDQLDHAGLVERIVDLFLDDPTRHPLWLQYMIIHFSGMRYQSAHGSWGDPRELLLSLKTKSIYDKLQSDGRETLEGEAALEAGILRTLPDAGTPEAREVIAALESEDIFVKRRTLQDVWLEKKEALVAAMTDEQVLKALEDMSNLLPTWMWKEVVARTDLRLAHAGADWESLSELDREGYYDRRNAEFREILLRWKEKNLTMWREEHARANRLIVTRAVCNEVAEHIQHLRGVSPPGGLTAKPVWYRGEEKAGRTAVDGERPFFSKIRGPADLRPGASILWLRWVRGKPNIWRITRPLELSGGEGLLPAGLIKANARQELKSQRNRVKAGLRGSWVCELLDDGFRRSRYTAAFEQNPNNPKKTRIIVSDQPDEEWLRWMHEATVVATGETAEGNVVLTFETALPYEDPRRSTIGVFKRYAGHLVYNVNEDVLNGTFAGYVPAGEIPLGDLRAMLDWRKVAPGKEIPQERIDRYWRLVEQNLSLPPGGADQPAEPLVPEDHPVRWVEAAPPFQAADREFTLCYRMAPDKNRPGRFKAEVVQPRIELRRGLHFEVSLRDTAKVGDDRYSRIVRCEADPKAVGLYVRDSEVVGLPEGTRSLPFQALDRINVRSVSRLNDKGKPVLMPAGIRLVEGTMLRVSAVHHKVSDRGAGAGVIDTDGTEDYYLVVACPARPVAEGLFVRVSEVSPVDEAGYEAGKLGGAEAGQNGKPVRAAVVPEDERKTAALFRPASGAAPGRMEFDRVWQEIPKGSVIEIGQVEFTRSGKVFYPILAHEPDQALTGFFIRRKELEILPGTD